MKKLHHKESDEQIRCVKWFRVTFPEFARLMEHPKNEGCGHTAEDRKRQIIAKKEGVQAGVSDLIFHFPSFSNYYKGELQEEPVMYHALAIELKWKNGRQSPDQKLFQRYFEAAGGLYLVVRSYEDFQDKVGDYMRGVPSGIRETVKELYDQVEREATEAARRELQRIINKA